jgi:hypothetical protein
VSDTPPADDEPVWKKPPSKAGWVGPLFGWEIIRLARRGQDMRARFILAVSLLFVLTFFTLIWFYKTDPYEVFFSTGLSLTIEDSAKFGTRFCFTFLFAQLGIMVLLTPAYAAGGISEEKEKKTFTYLLVSDLTSRELFLGKFLGRVGFLLGIMFAGLPILSMTQIYGGVSINLIMMAYLLTTCTVILHAAIAASSAMATSTYRGALFRSYGIAALHCIVGFGHPVAGPFGILVVLWTVEDNLLWFLVLGFGYSGLELLGAGLAIFLGIRWTRNLRARPRRDTPRDPDRHRRREQRKKYDDDKLDFVQEPLLILEESPPGDSTEPILLAKRLAPVPAPPPSTRRDVEEPRMRRRQRPPAVRTPTGMEARNRPRIGERDPFEWKEQYTTGQKSTVDDDSIRGVFLAVGIAAGVTITFFGAILLLALFVSGFSESTRTLSNRFFLVSGFCGFFVYLLMVGMTAASSVVRERQRNTLESLLAIPVDRNRILQPKSRVAFKRAAWWGIPTGLLIPTGVAFSTSPLMAVPVLLFVGLSLPLIVAYGVYLSVRCHTATKATMWLLPMIAAITLMPLLLVVSAEPRSPVIWLGIAFVPVLLAAGLAWYFWRRAHHEFETYDRN